MKGLTYPSTYHAMKAGPCRVGVCKHEGKCGKCDEYGTLRRYAARDVDRIHELRALVKEMADEKRISDAVIKSLRDKKLEMAGEIAAKEAEVSALRALVGEMADALDTTIHYRDFICDCGEPSLHNCSVRSRVCFAKNRLLVMKARNLVKAEGGER